MLIEEAVKLVMEARGYKFGNDWKHEHWKNGYWYKEGYLTLTPEQALAECLDLNKLAEVWSTLDLVIEFANKGKFWCCQLTEFPEGKAFSADGKTIHEAALLATAEALKAVKPC